ncbi:DUF2513 domain-containing protein [Aeromonas veronii]|uniref:DUF2513 domain-containing protein n=1 Tax=Aeromonas veronii TaxID=654 RepID=UPI0039F6D3DC
MKRDWDMVRLILTKLEELPNTDSYLTLGDFASTDPERAYVISYHVSLLMSAGLVNGQMSATLGRGPKNFSASRLTWEGHEFLDAIRSESVWNKTKETFASRGIEMTFDLIKTVASGIAVSFLGLPA